jgi:hypothetical protein
MIFDSTDKINCYNCIATALLNKTAKAVLLQ